MRQSLSSGIAGLTNAQLTDHYANCMKLSAENKITVKNAFGLHLIDYMAELLKKNDGSTNFQMASCTLDASAKIYAYRVDCVHADVYKMAGGLSLAEEPKKTAEADDAEMPDDVQKTVRKKKKTKKSATVETNVKALNINKLELGFQADALFLKMSKAFEEGGINGLLLNICGKNDSSELLLDASATYWCGNDQREFSQLSIPKDAMGPLYQIKSDEKFELCPSISNFSFINKDSFMDDEDNDDARKKTNHTFDINVDPEPVEVDRCDDDVFVGDNAGFDAGDDEIAMDVFEPDELTAADINAVPVNCAARRNESIAAVRLESVADLTNVLAEEPTEYSYFDHNLLTAWAGPNHWRLRPFSKSKASFMPQAEVPHKKTKKLTISVNFELVDEVKKLLSSFCKSGKLAKKTLQQWDPDKTTLPDDLFYDPKKLNSLSHIQVFVSYTSKSQPEVSSHVGEYDYDNANDRENYCPDIPCSQDDDEQLDTFPALSQSFGSPIRPSGPEAEATAENAEAYTGSNLVEQPQKVEKVQIAYAKIAKKIDVKRLKAAMWDILVHRDAENKENVDLNEPPPTTMKEPMTFSDMYAKLPGRVSTQIAKSLSVPVAFVCFLYLANEKSLYLGENDLNDFTIMQG